MCSDDSSGRCLFGFVLAFFVTANAFMLYCVFFYWYTDDPDNVNRKMVFWAWPALLIYQFFFWNAIISYLRGSFGDPGYVENLKKETPTQLLPEKLVKDCPKCGRVWNPPRAHHCKRCKKCVLRMDHHCDWINNCVGIKNQKYFILFLFHTLIYCLMTAGFQIAVLVFWCQAPWKTTAKIVNPWRLVGHIFIFGLGLFFAHFTWEFLGEQYTSIKDNQTTVETYKNLVGKPGPFWVNFKQIFGKDKRNWIFPTAPKIEVNCLELLYSPQSTETSYLEDEFQDNALYQQYFI